MSEELKNQLDEAQRQLESAKAYKDLANSAAGELQKQLDEAHKRLKEWEDTFGTDDVKESAAEFDEQYRKADEAQKRVAQLREALFLVLCRFREWEPSLFDNPDSTDLGEAIAKAKKVYESLTPPPDFIHKRELAYRKPVNFAQDQWDALTPATQKAILWDELQDHLESLTKESSVLDTATPLRDLGKPFHEGKQIGWKDGKQPLEERKEVIMNELKIMLALAGAQGWKSPEEFQELRTQLEEAQKRVAQLREALEFYSHVSSWVKSFASNDFVDLKEGDMMMVFLEGEDHPWSVAKEALSSTPSPDFIHKRELENTIELLTAIQRVACREGLRGIEEDCHREVQRIESLTKQESP